MNIADLRRELGDRIEAAFFRDEPTIIRHGRRQEPRAALVPAKWLDELYRLREQVKKPPADPS